jgi:hypothetical protein
VALGVAPIILGFEHFLEEEMKEERISRH